MSSLYVVSTPIGNLKDITLRALEVLGSCSIIAAEDTRESGKILARFEIHVPMTSYHDFNKEEKAPVLVERMRQGESVALVCDAGTPTISDPGYYLINRAIEAGIPVIPIPGPSAAIAALAVSGLPTDRFVFEGFLSKKSGQRAARLSKLAEEARTLVFFESPFRIQKILAEIAEAFGGGRRAVLAREMTKLHEEIIRGTLSEICAKIAQRRLKGEITLVIEGKRERLTPVGGGSRSGRRAPESGPSR